jgi:GT2 family glycosyltransferase
MTIPAQPLIDLSNSIVIPTLAFLKPCLDSINDTFKRISFEVLVVDNAPQTNSAIKSKNTFHGGPFVQYNPFGFAKNNKQLKKASGRYLMLLNAIRYDPGTLEKAVQFLDQHPEIGAVGCEMVYPDGTFQVASARKNRTLLSEILIETGLNRRWNYILPTPARGQEFVNIEMCSEAGLIVRREVVEQIGLLDEQFFMYGEGADWCRRIRQADWKIVFLPGTRIVHYGDQTNKRVKLKMYLQFTCAIFVFKKRMT